MTDEKETTSKDANKSSYKSAAEQADVTPSPESEAPSVHPGDETGLAEGPVVEAALDAADSAEPAAGSAPPPHDQNGTSPAAEKPHGGGQAAPGGIAGLIILLLVASTVGGLIVALWPGTGSDRPGTALSSNADKRLNAAEDRITSLQKQLDQTQKSFHTLQATVESDEGTTASPEAASVINDIRSRVEALENSAIQFSPGTSPQTPGGTGLANLNQQLAALTARVQKLEQTAPPPDLQERLDHLAPTEMVKQLSDRVAALEADRSGREAQKAAFTLTVANLTRATENGEPFASDLQALSLLAPGLEVPQSVDAIAQTGVRSQQALVDEFGDLSFKALKADRQKTGANWIDKLQANFDSVFAVRRKGEMQGDSTEAILARAESRLDKKDLAGALTELKNLDGPAAETMAPWGQEASARLEIESFLTRLNQMVVERLATDGSNP